LKYYPDLAVIPECEYIGEDTSKKLWFGDNRKKRNRIFSYSDFISVLGIIVPIIPFPSADRNSFYIA
jgi:hypothetical protein